MDRFTQLLQESYQTPRELTPPPGSWERLARDLAARKRRRRWLIWWFSGSFLLLSLGLFAWWSSTPSLGAFPIAQGGLAGPLVHAQSPGSSADADTKASLHSSGDLAQGPPQPIGAKNTYPAELSAPVTLTSIDKGQPNSFKNATPENSHRTLEELADQAERPASPSFPELPTQAAPPSALATTPAEDLPGRKQPTSDLPIKQAAENAAAPRIATTGWSDTTKARMEPAPILPTPRENVWRFFLGGQQRVDGLVLMTYTDYPLISQQQPLKSIDDTDLYALSFASARQRTSYLELGIGLQRYWNERLSFNYQLSFFSGSFTSESLEPYVRVNTTHYRETGTTRIRALQAEYGLAWDLLTGPKLRLAPYAGLLYQFTLQSTYRGRVSTPGQSLSLPDEIIPNPPHVTDEFRLRLGGLLHLPLQKDWELSIAAGITTEFLDIPRPAVYGNIGIGRTF